MSAPPMRQRLVRGTQAQVVGLSVRLVIQIGMVAVLVAAWGLDLYGEWLILAAVPTYIALSDVGLFAAGSNAMIMDVARGDRPAALAVFQSVSIFVGALFVAVAVFLVTFAELAPLTDWLGLKTLSETDTTVILVTLGLNVLVGAYATILYGGFASVGRYGEGAFVLSGLELFQFGALVVAVALGASPVTAAVVLFFAGFPGALVMYRRMRHHAPWLRLGRPHEIRATLRPLVSPALASAAFPAALSLNVQGMVILLGVIASPAIAAIFSTLRTMSRAIIQALARVFTVLAPEFSRAYAEGNAPRLRSLHRYGCQAAIWIALPVIAVLAVFGDKIISVWTSGEIDAEGLLLYLFLAVVALNAVWLTSMALLFGENRHQRLAIAYVLASAACLPLAYVLYETWGIDGAAAALVALELFMVVTTLRQSLPAAHDTLMGWVGHVLRPPPIHRLRGLAGGGDGAGPSATPVAAAVPPAATPVSSASAPAPPE